MDILEQYKNVFEDCIECWCDAMDIEIGESEKSIIVDKLIYKSDYMWDVINEHIATYVYNLKEEK